MEELTSKQAEVNKFIKSKNLDIQIKVNGFIPLIDAFIEYQEQVNVPLGSVSNSLFIDSMKLLRDLAELQNGAPLIKFEKDFNTTMDSVWNFLDENEINDY